jgi:hypothetical protein
MFDVSCRYDKCGSHCTDTNRTKIRLAEFGVEEEYADGRHSCSGCSVSAATRLLF